MAPGYQDGMVYVSTVPLNASEAYEGGGVGILWALDAKTGNKQWHFNTVPEQTSGAIPTSTAGGGVWYPPAFDGKGSMYFGVGNPAPFPGTGQIPLGIEPARPKPLHQLAGQAQRQDRQARTGTTRSRRTTSTTGTSRARRS